MTWLGLVGFALLVVALAAETRAPSANAPPAAPLLHPGDGVALVGDSLAVGLGRPLDVALGRAAVEAHEFGRGATNAGQWLSRGWLDEALAKRPDVVVVSLGTNDARFLADAFPERARELVRRVEATGARAVWLVPPEMPFETGPIVAGIRRSGALVFEPPQNLERASDRVHLTAAGYRAWAEAIAAALTRPR